MLGPSLPDTARARACNTLVPPDGDGDGDGDMRVGPRIAAAYESLVTNLPSRLPSSSAIGGRNDVTAPRASRFVCL
jgi:hypothetical protein